MGRDIQMLITNPRVSTHINKQHQSDTWVLRVIQSYQIPFLSPLFQENCPVIRCLEAETHLISKEIQTLLLKKTIRKGPTLRGVGLIFLNPLHYSQKERNKECSFLVRPSLGPNRGGFICNSFIYAAKTLLQLATRHR